MTTTLHSPPPSERDGEAPGPRIPALLLWYAVLGGTFAWAVHEILTWSALEITCQRVEVGPGTYVYVGLTTGIPFLVALGALLTSLAMRARLPRVSVDELTRGRTQLMITVGLVLDLLALAAIVGDGIAIGVLQPC